MRQVIKILSVGKLPDSVKNGVKCSSEGWCRLKETHSRVASRRQPALRACSAIGSRAEATMLLLTCRASKQKVRLTVAMCCLPLRDSTCTRASWGGSGPIYDCAPLFSSIASSQLKLGENLGGNKAERRLFTVSSRLQRQHSNAPQD